MSDKEVTPKAEPPAADPTPVPPAAAAPVEAPAAPAAAPSTPADEEAPSAAAAAPLPHSLTNDIAASSTLSSLDTTTNSFSRRSRQDVFESKKEGEFRTGNARLLVESQSYLLRNLHSMKDDLAQIDREIARINRFETENRRSRMYEESSYRPTFEDEEPPRFRSRFLRTTRERTPSYIDESDPNLGLSFKPRARAPSSDLAPAAVTVPVEAAEQAAAAESAAPAPAGDGALEMTI